MNKEDLQKIIDSPTPVLIKFGVKTGCKFCDQFRPIFDEFAQGRSDCFIHEKETMKDEDEVIQKYNITSYPTTIAFQNGKEINRAKGAITKEVLETLTKTLQNISEKELQRYIDKLTIDTLNAKMAFENLDDKRMEAINEAVRRQQEAQLGESIATAPTPIDDFPLPSNTATTLPVEACESCQ